MHTGKNKSWIEKEGRIYFEVTTTGFTAEEWRLRIINSDHKLNFLTEYVLSYTHYDEDHRYEPNKTLKVVLINAKEVIKNSERLSKKLKEISVKDFGENSVLNLKGELSLLIREKFTNKELEEMGLHYIAVLHEPILDCDFDANVFILSRDEEDYWFSAIYDSPDTYESEWDIYGGFAFLQD